MLPSLPTPHTPTHYAHTYTHISNTSLLPHYPVIGWFNTTTQMGIDSFTAPEDALGYDIRVDYIKGSGPTNLQFIVTAVPLGTTSMSTSVMSTLYFEPPAHPHVLPGVSDYFLSTTSVGLGNNARVTLRPDAIAMEPDEVLQLILTPTETTAVTLMRDTNTFLSDTLNVTIIDPNSKLNSQFNHNFIGTIKKIDYIPRPNNSWANNFIWNSPYLD